MGETLAAGLRRLPRASDLSGSGLSHALPFGVLGHGSGALLGGVQAQPATSPSPALAAGAPSAMAAGISPAVPRVATPAGLAPGVAVDRIRDPVFGMRLANSRQRFHAAGTGRATRARAGARTPRPAAGTRGPRSSAVIR